MMLLLSKQKSVESFFQFKKKKKKKYYKYNIWMHPTGKELRRKNSVT